MDSQPILIIDDNPANLKLARDLLRGEGLEVYTATDGEEALQMLEHFHPRLILMDLQLPGMDGLVLSRFLKGNPETRDIVLVALTAYAMKGDEEKARASGCDGFITKPIDTRMLPRLVKQYLGRETPSVPRTVWGALT